MTLSRDASAYNVQFHHGRPLPIDSLSFERSEPDAVARVPSVRPEHFLAPLHPRPRSTSASASCCATTSRASRSISPRGRCRAERDCPSASGRTSTSTRGRSDDTPRTTPRRRHRRAAPRCPPSALPRSSKACATPSPDSPGAAGDGVGRLCRQHQLPRQCHRGQGDGRRPMARIGGSRAWTSVPTPVATAGWRRTRARSSRRTSIRPPSSAAIAPSAPMGEGHHPAAGGHHQPQPAGVGPSAPGCRPEYTPMSSSLALCITLPIGANVPLPMIATLFAQLAHTPSSRSCPRRTPPGPAPPRDAILPTYHIDGFRAAFAVLRDRRESLEQSADDLRSFDGAAARRRRPAWPQPCRRARRSPTRRGLTRRRRCRLRR